MNCRGRRHKIYLYVDGELKAGESTRMEEHLRRCAACQLVENQIRQLSGLLKATSEKIEPSVQFESRFWQRVQGERASGRFIEWLEAITAPLVNLRLSQVAVVFTLAVLIGGAGGVVSTSRSTGATYDSRSSIPHLSGFKEFKGVPLSSVAASYLKTLEGELG